MDIFLARQPIFDVHEKVVGYELFYQGVPTEEAPDGLDPYEMAQHVIVDAFTGIGLDQLTHNRPAYLKVTGEMLLNGSVELLDPKKVMLVLDSERRDPEVVDACTKVVAKGYRLALDHYVYAGPVDPLLQIAEVVKVSVRHQSPAYLSRLVERVRPHGITLLAEDAENATERDRCIELGFELFQGFRFSQPEVVAKRDLPVEYLHTFQLMKEIRNPDSSDASIEEGFRRDVSLTYKLLRIVNSAAMGGREIQSIGQAIRLLGRDALNRWLALLLLSSVGTRGVKAELSEAALLRGRMCELLAEPSGRPSASGTLFIVGLFSMIDQLLVTPMEEVIAHMNFTADVKEALLSRTGPYGAVLSLVGAYEAGRWQEVTDRCQAMDVPEFSLSGIYFDALGWAKERRQQVSA